MVDAEDNDNGGDGVHGASPVIGAHLLGSRRRRPSVLRGYAADCNGLETGSARLRH